MDTSEEYIHQCDCEEVQEHRKYDGGDWICDPDNGHSWAIWQKVRGKTDEEVQKFMDGLLWLPRQDQIQEMMEVTAVFDFESAVYEMFFTSDNHAHYNSTPEWRVMEYDSSERYCTPEQLWLGYYMYKQHNKTWDGEKWVSNE